MGLCFSKEKCHFEIIDSYIPASQIWLSVNLFDFTEAMYPTIQRCLIVQRQSYC
jgi:hypothetical protein